MCANPRLDITDPRGGDRFVRFSWHPERRMIIVSHWREGVCVSTTRIGPEHFAEIIGFVGRALSDLALQPPRSDVVDDRGPTVSSLARPVRTWLRPHLAEVIALAERHLSHRASRRRSA